MVSYPKHEYRFQKHYGKNEGWTPPYNNTGFVREFNGLADIQCLITEDMFKTLGQLMCHCRESEVCRDSLFACLKFQALSTNLNKGK